jgi:hypothetical protein
VTVTLPDGDRLESTGANEIRELRTGRVRAERQPPDAGTEAVLPLNLDLAAVPRGACQVVFEPLDGLADVPGGGERDAQHPDPDRAP